MSYQFNDKDPIYIQIKKRLEDQIVNQELTENDQIPSTTEMVNFYQVNHITVSKGVNLLVDEGIIYKKRGIGMFVAEGAREKLLEKRRGDFIDRYIVPMLKEADKLDIDTEELKEMIKAAKESDIDSS
ncbi:GntR family transcriptional regulator [Halanaerobiaceae bacterium Z-7014]|uniref:GntR family transcriptional regulator n=1 Tax=Halonatronomonas betaini TaxID=2778430 RepID=A0A931ASE2_9FIRM|nr:GntR family transcriptional regulator [Halonatronomonas betaini]MBF8437269.1 GntR family transcriptional regulator [Halonatronomonas betaini]